MSGAPAKTLAKLTGRECEERRLEGVNGVAVCNEPGWTA